MSFKSALLFSLFVTLYLHPTSPFPTSRMLNSNSVAKSGKVTLNKDNFGFYVNVDFDYHLSDASDSEAYDPSRSYVSLALYTSQTLLTYSCLGFYSYYCMSYSSCNLYTELLSTPVYPDFEVSTGYLANTHVYLDYNNWVLGSGSENLATIATSCSANDGPNTYGSQRYGLIGLGVNATQLNFFSDSPIFSISLAQDGTSGTLLFESNSDIVSSSSKVGQLSTTSDWHITSSIVTVAVNGGNDIVTTASAIFDLNADALGLPSATFAFLIDHLEEASTMICSDDQYMPSCTYNGLIKDLPTITLTIQGVGFDIPPTLYVYGHDDEDTTVTQIYLNLRGLDPSNIGNSYVTPEYQNYIIFDQTFMSYYYTEFAYNNGAPTVTVYNPNNPISKVIWPYIVGGVVALIVIIVVIICCVKRRKNRRRDQAQRRRNRILNESSQSEEVPLAQNNIPSSAVQNYPNYAYPQLQFPNPNHHHNAQQGMNNFAPPMEQREQREQATNNGEGYVPPHPVARLEGNTGEGQPLYNNEYLQARQAFIRGDNKK